ncbi:MAG TPA: cyclic-phosphate processing receiver domain-containing protein [Verrucomicrobiae bacterium]
MRNEILILEDNEERRTGFTAVLKELAPDCRILFWNNARVMIDEFPPHLANARLISLDHDLNEVALAEDARDGLLVAEFLATQKPSSPVIVHSSNYERSLSMVNELTYGGWTVERIGPVCADWITTLWQPVVAKLLSAK